MLLFVFLHGCAYTRFVAEADRLESAGDWVAAQEQFDLALQEHPKSDTARSGIDRMLVKQVDDHVKLAEKALAAADFRAVVQHLTDARAIDDDRPDVYDVEQRTRQSMAAGAAGLVAAGRQEDAYRLLLLTHELFPGMPVGEGLEAMRRHFLELADALQQQGQPDDAQRALDVIATLEPDRAASLEARRHILQADQAEQMFLRAEQARLHQDHGAAALLAQRAFEIGGRERDRALVTAMIERLRAEAPLAIQVVAPRDPRGADLLELLAQRLRPLTDARPARGPAQLDIVLRPSPPACSESSTPSVRPQALGDTTVELPIEHWTLTCTAPLTIEMRPTWPTEQPLERTFEPAPTSTDDAHAGLPGASIPADPKTYPENPKLLVQAADTASMAEVWTWTEALIDEYYQRRTESVAIHLTQDPRLAATEALQLLLLPGRVPEAGRSLLRTQLCSAFGLTALPDLTAPQGAEAPGSAPQPR